MIKTKVMDAVPWALPVCSKCHTQNVIEANFCSHCGINLGYSFQPSGEAVRLHCKSGSTEVLEKFMTAEPASFLRPYFKPPIDKLYGTFACCYLNKGKKFIKGYVTVHNQLIRYRSRSRIFPKRIAIPLIAINRIKYKNWCGGGLIMISSSSNLFSFSFYQDDAVNFYKIITA